MQHLRITEFLIAAVREWWSDDAPRLGASLAYYTLFAIAPVLLIAISIAGSIFGAEAVRGEIVGQIGHLVGRDSAQAVQQLLEGASKKGTGLIASVVGSVTFIIAAMGAFLELQTALNIIWRVKPKPGLNLKSFVLDRARSFGLVIAIGFLLLVSLAISAALAALAHALALQSPTNVPLLWNAVNTAGSLGIITVLFALVYRFLPDVQLRWRDVWTGALVTAILFTVGKELVGLYLGQSSTVSSYGAAGSIIVLLLWVYYTSQILLLGAEFTKVYAASKRSQPPSPEPFAKKTARLPGRLPQRP